MHSGSNRSTCHARDLDSERLCFLTLSADSVGLLSQSLWLHVLIHAMLAFSRSLKLLIVVTSLPQCVRRLDSFDSSAPPRTSRLATRPLRTPFTSSVSDVLVTPLDFPDAYPVFLFKLAATGRVDSFSGMVVSPARLPGGNRHLPPWPCEPPSGSILAPSWPPLDMMSSGSTIPLDLEDDPE